MDSDTPDFDGVRRYALALPAVSEENIHGAPSFKTNRKLLCCPAIHKSAESNSILVRISVSERAELIKQEPHIYYLTDHYVRYDMVLVRLAQISHPELKGLLQKSWQFAQQK